ncbi:MAG: hypothetical protein PWQ25_1723 [Deferribacteres bacterium]|jgi:hypothetical protein|nr:hypothetical protein [Deferribacteres bacterium]
MFIKAKCKENQKRARKQVGCHNIKCKECGIEFDYREVVLNRYFCPICGNYMEDCTGCGQCGRWN